MEATLNTPSGRTDFELSYVGAPDGARIAVYAWPAPAKPRAVVQITHGLAEHAARYSRFANALTRAGYAVYASDHRGHGQTARDASELGFFAPDNGFSKLVEDLHLVNRRIAAAHPDLPRVLFAHSFGSFVAQAYLFAHADSVDAVVLSGTTLANPMLVAPGMALARVERRRLGARGKSRLLQKLTFGAYNDAFQPARTEFDWLSRDPAEVDKYLADPLCGFEASVQGWLDLFGGLLWIRSSARQRSIPKQLPVHVISGREDPVGEMGRGPSKLARRLGEAGLERVTLQLYTGARHELLNETNREQVTRDLLAWLDRALPR